MSVENKKILSIVVYYTLAAVALLSAGFFLYCNIIKDIATWAKVIYYVWIGLTFGAVIFDIICTTTGEAKQISGLIIYILSLLALIMTCILYFANTGATGLSADFFNLFISISILGIITSGFMIATWCVGESLVEHASAENEMR